MEDDSAQRKLFGTDGIRGLANDLLTPSLAFDVARAAGETLLGDDGPVLIGRDTRRSGPMLSAALVAGFTSVGADVVDLGVLPVGGVSRLTRTTGAALGVMVSASHNPAPDNGIKLIGGDGNKVSDEVETAVETRYHRRHPYRAPTGAGIGTATVMLDAVDRYLDLLTGDLGQPFAGMAFALDCAHGAAHLVAPRLFRRLGADVEVHGASPDGMNINDGWGATHPEALAGVAHGRVGFCLDGDADRLIAVDEDGQVVNGDRIMAILARHMKAGGALVGNRVVTTVMSNLGFRRAMSDLGIDVVETRVGDRYVLEAMKETGACLGGEQSGHIVLEDHLSGDGLRTAIRLAQVLHTTGAELRELRQVMVDFPQVLLNVAVTDRTGLDAADDVWAAVTEAEAALAGAGRVLVRPSGTEPLVRVMVEASTADIAEDVATMIARTVTSALG